MTDNVLKFPGSEAMPETSIQDKAGRDLAAFCAVLADLLNNPLDCLARLRMQHPDSGASMGFNSVMRHAMNDIRLRQREVENFVNPRGQKSEKEAV